MNKGATENAIAAKKMSQQMLKLKNRTNKVKLIDFFRWQFFCLLLSFKKNPKTTINKDSSKNHALIDALGLLYISDK